MYQELARLVSYPDAQLFEAVDVCIQVLATEDIEAATLLEHFRDLARKLGQDGLEETYIQVFEMRAEVRFTSATSCLGKTGAGAPLWPVSRRGTGSAGFRAVRNCRTTRASCYGS